MIEIDGSHGEGGGQILRTSIALSAVTGMPVRVSKIRAGRCNPGLQAQHLAGIVACKKICNAQISGASVGSTEIEFHPGNVSGGEYRIDVGTAGAISLVLQAVMIPVLHSGKEFALELTGGTHVKWSPTMDYFNNIFLWNIGTGVSGAIKKYGFFPKGGGVVNVHVRPSGIRHFNMTERGEMRKISALSMATRGLQQARVAERQAGGAAQVFEDAESA